MEDTVLFYGAYFNRTVLLPDGETHEYNMALFYLCALGTGYLLSFLLLVKKYVQ